MCIIQFCTIYTKSYVYTLLGLWRVNEILRMIQLFYGWYVNFQAFKYFPNDITLKSLTCNKHNHHN